ncbi:MAG: DNA repair protein RadA [Rhodovibrionaceae bacterium]
MAKRQSIYVCQSCGTSFGRWVGRCEACGEWNSIVEEATPSSAPGGLKPKTRKATRAVEFADLAGAAEKAARRGSGIAEFDRVCGGGLVRGSAVLIGGDPGIGKSTLLLQVVAALSGGENALSCAYISGEEAVDQVRLRARRMGLAESDVQLASATAVRDICAALERLENPGVVVIDSIQTMYVDSLDSAPGTVSQVRASAQELIRLAKSRGFCLLLVGHVTKEGVIAGPKVLEHMVDSVLTFEGERGHQFRILRAVKNRFGPTDEIGVFEMTDAGLMEVANPSELFLGDRQEEVSGAAVFAGMEGTRPVLVEIQALVSPSPLATPRRAVVGWDSGRLAMVMAVLEARCGLLLAGKDVYLNVAGGLRIGEPAADLAVAAALISAVSGKAVPQDCVVFGEIGLSGEIRPVSHGDLRLKEAAKLGFVRALLPRRRKARAREKAGGDSAIALTEIGHLRDLVAEFGGARTRDTDSRQHG